MYENASIAVPAEGEALQVVRKEGTELPRTRTRAAGRVDDRHAVPFALASDDLLVARTRAGEREAFEILVKRYQDRVYSIVYGLIRDPDDALDLVQDTFIKAYQGLNSFRGGSSFYTWLYRIAVNNCKDLMRRRVVRPAISLEDEQLNELGFEPPAGSAFDPVITMESKEFGVVVQAAIDTLPEKMRWAVVLHDIQEIPQQEVAVILGCPVGTVKSHVFRGRARLRKLLGRYVEGED